MAGIPISTNLERIVRGRKPYVTLGLIVINVAVFIITYSSPSLLVPYAKTPDDVYMELGAVPITILRGEKLWTLLTSMFLHGDIAHLFGNMLFLYVFGGHVENAMGGKRYLCFYLLSGIFAHLFHILSISFIPVDWLLTSYGYTPWVVPAIGASGAISGVMGAYLVFYPHSRLELIYFIGFLPIFIPLPAWLYLVVWLLIQLFLGLMIVAGYSYSSVAFWAHVGGFIAGVAFAPYFLDPKIKKILEYRKKLSEYGYYVITPYYYEYT